VAVSLSKEPSLYTAGTPDKRRGRNLLHSKQARIQRLAEAQLVFRGLGLHVVGGRLLLGLGQTRDGDDNLVGRPSVEHCLRGQSDRIP
jgi:hypothetical protein